MILTRITLGLFIFCVASVPVVLGQYEVDRPEMFLLERKNVSFGTSSEYKHFVSSWAGGDINSSFITNTFFTEFLYKRSFIDADLIDDQLDRAGPSNRLGSSIQGGLYGSLQTAKGKWEAGITYKDFYSGNFSKDAFTLVFKGNASYAGSSASLEPLSILGLTTQNIFIGYRKSIGKAATTEIGCRFGVSRASNILKVKMEQGALFTEQNGAYLELSGDIQAFYSNASSKAGLGAFTDLYFQTKWKEWNISAEIRDIGFIRSGQLTSYNESGTFRYEGIAVDNIFGEEGFKLTGITIDTILQNFGIQPKIENKLILMPSTFHLGGSKDFGKKWTSFFGVKMIAAPGYMPKLYTRWAYYFSKSLAIQPGLSFGGFGNLDVELGVAKSFADKYFISTQLFWIEYLVAPSITSGHGMSVALSMRW